MKKIISFATNHPIPILMIVLFFVLMGLFSTFTMNADFLPTLEKRKLLVSSEYEGIAAKELKTLVTIPLEDALGSLSGVKKMTSVTRDGLSLISIELHWGSDIDMVLVECREIIDSTFSILPAGCNKPSVKALESINECITISMTPLDNDLKYGRYIAEHDIKPRLQRINGVGTVSISGGEKEQIEVVVSKDKMDARQLSLETISNAVASANFEYPAGTIVEGEKIVPVKTSGLYTDIAEIGKTPILYNESGLLRLSDIANVVETIEEKETFFLHNGKECIKIGIKKKNNASPLAVSRAVVKELEALNKVYGNYYSFSIINDLSKEVKTSIFSLLLSAIISCVVASLIIFYFLRSIKISLVISSVIPISCLFSLCILHIFGKSINVISLSGLAIGIGMVIDCSSVVIENIQKKFTKYNNREKLESISDKEIIVQGTEEVVLSNIGSTLTTVVVFIPVFFLEGILGELFVDLALGIVSSISVSCILSLTYIPTMCSINIESLKKVSKEIKLVDCSKTVYKKILDGLFKKKFLVIIIMLLITVVGIGSFMLLDFELLPTLNSNTVVAEIFFPQNSTLQNIQEKSLDIQNQLAKNNNVFSISVEGGVEDDDYEYLSSPFAVKEKVRFTIVLSEDENSKQSIIDIFENLRYEIVLSSETDLLSEILEISNNDYVVMADSEEELNNKIEQIQDVDFRIQPNYVDFEYVFVPDRISNARFSVSALATANFAYYLLEGIETAPFYKEGREIPVLVKLAKNDITSVEDLENSFIQLENSVVPLRSFGEISLKQNEKVLYRYNRKDAKILQELNKPLEQTDSILSLKEQDIKEMLGDGLVLLIIVILLLYLVMGAQFESFVIPLFLMIALPPAFAGAFSFLYIFNQSLNINSIIALVILFGTSVNNTILLYESCIRHEKITAKTIIKDCVEKTRSLFVTNFTTIFALIPFAIDPKGTNAQASMSTAIIGGLLVSLVIVMFVIPIIFYFTLRKKGKTIE